MPIHGGDSCVFQSPFHQNKQSLPYRDFKHGALMPPYPAFDDQAQAA
ncbi:hypothetical protein NOC27_848 [Nitrosococcus oceani AFC27]|nr:hypothetical protein NOC27_848 [Nitrosococcus oceani AFC27]